MTSRERVAAALAHRMPDRTPVDFLAVPEIWRGLQERFACPAVPLDDSRFFDPAWEAVLRALEVDCRVLSYDQFCAPPHSALAPGGRVEWWDVGSRSTPSRMWRWKAADGLSHDVFGRAFRVQATASGSYEENVPVLASAQSLADVRSHPWPEPDWWDFSRVNEAVREMNADTEYHVRYRAGSVFEIAWQLRGMDTFFMDMAVQPEIPRYMMERLAEVQCENIHRVLDAAGGGIDMVYFYDDVASTTSLLMSLPMWEELIRPCHRKLIEAAKSHGASVMYHSDGALRPLLDRLIDLGVDVLNPLQPNAEGMEPAGLKRDFGDRLCFHGGMDIIGVLPKGTPGRVKGEAMRLVSTLGRNGGYILASSHHVQADTPVENVLAMYDTRARMADPG
jgi:uroporphyrinogen decarboxylase